MNQEIEKDIKIRLEINPKTYISLTEIEEMIDEKVEYIELVNLIRNLIGEKILKAVREGS